MKVAQLCLTLCNPMNCKPASLLCPWNSPGKDTRMDSCSLLQAPSWIYFLILEDLQGIFPTQGSNPGLPHCCQSEPPGKIHT